MAQSEAAARLAHLGTGITDGRSPSGRFGISGNLDVHGHRDSVTVVSRVRRGNDSVRVCSQCVREAR